MKLLNDQEVTDWVSLRGIDEQKRKLTLKNGFKHWLVLEMPKGAREQMVLSGDLLLLGGADEQVTDLIWISTWRIWGSWNDDLGEFVVTRLRADRAPITPLNFASGHLLQHNDRMLAAALLWQTMIFNWDAYIIPSTGDYLIECSHDELVWIMSKTEIAHSHALDQLARWKPSTRGFVTT